MSSQSEGVFDLAGNRRGRKRPQSDLTHHGSPHIPKSRTRDFHGRAHRNPSRIYMGPWTAVAGDVDFCFSNQQNERVGSLRFSLWKPSPFLVLLLWHQPTASEFKGIWTIDRPGGPKSIQNQCMISSCLDIQPGARSAPGKIRVFFQNAKEMQRKSGARSAPENFLGYFSPC